MVAGKPVYQFQTGSWFSEHPVSSVWAVEQGMRETCFHVRYRLISGRRDNREVADSTIDVTISRNQYEP